MVTMSTVAILKISNPKCTTTQAKDYSCEVLLLSPSYKPYDWLTKSFVHPTFIKCSAIYITETSLSQIKKINYLHHIICQQGKTEVKWQKTTYIRKWILCSQKHFSSSHRYKGLRQYFKWIAVFHFSLFTYSQISN